MIHLRHAFLIGFAAYILGTFLLAIFGPKSNDIYLAAKLALLPAVILGLVSGRYKALGTSVGAAMQVRPRALDTIIGAIAVYVISLIVLTIPFNLEQLRLVNPPITALIPAFIAGAIISRRRRPPVASEAGDRQLAEASTPTSAGTDIAGAIGRRDDERVD